MAIIGSIRKRQGLILGFLGISLLLFLVTSMTQDNGFSLFNGGADVVGTVDGEEVKYEELQSLINERFSQSSNGSAVQRSQAWNALVNEKLITKEAEGLGLSVSNEELKAQITGAKSSIIQQYLQAGIFKRENLGSLAQGIDNDFANNPEEQKAALRDLVNQLRMERLQTKIGNLGLKAAFTPTWLLEKTSQENQSKATFQYVKVPFDVEGELEVSDSDIKNYIKNNASLYMNDEPTATVEYITFDIFPTAADSAATFAKIADWTTKFAEDGNDTLFVENRSGQISGKFFKKDELAGMVNNEAVKDSLFNSPVGSVFGPFVEGDVYKSVKLIDKQLVPDSVSARHILMAINQNNAAFIQKTMDSLKIALETGVANFDSVALQYSQDRSNKNRGGDLGTFAQGVMVAPFNDKVFFEMDKGDYDVVYTQFGLHLVQVTDKDYVENISGVRVATIERVIKPSEETTDAARSNVFDILASSSTIEDLNKFIADGKAKEMVSAPGLKPNDYNVLGLSPGDESRKIVSWAHGEDVEPGSVSPSVYTYKNPNRFYTNRFVIAALKEVQPAGLATVESKRKELYGTVMNELRGVKIADKLKGKSLGAVATEYDLAIDSASNVSFTAFGFNGINNENEVLSSAFQLNDGAVSAPIIGNNGVYIVKLLNKVINTDPISDVGANRKYSAGQVSINVGGLVPALKKAYGVEDTRYNIQGF